MDITITITRTYTEEEINRFLRIIKGDKECLAREKAYRYNDSDTVRSIKNQMRNYARKLGMTYTQAYNLVDRYSWHDLGD